MATAHPTSRDGDLPSFDNPKVQLVFEILCDDELPPNPEHRWESWYAKRIVAALFPRVGPADIIAMQPSPEASRAKKAPSANASNARARR
jgi:hypothetical protein